MTVHYGGRGPGHLSRWLLMAGISAAALSLDFTTGTLDPRITFSRSGNALVWDSTGKLTYAPNNLLTYSEDFTNATWAPSNIVATANQTTDPNGGTTADKLTTSGTAAIQRVRALSSTLTGGVICSFYLKAGTAQYAQILHGATAGTEANFDLSSGTVGAVGASVTATMTAVGGGWYRCAIKTTIATASNFYLYIVGSASSAYGASYPATVDYLYAWGAQVEAVTYETTPRTYNATTSAAYYGPRFDHDPVTLAAKGLLIEESRTNLLTYSGDLSNAAWTKTGASVSSATSIDGTSRPIVLVENTSTSTHGVSQSVTVTAVPTICWAIFEANGRDWTFVDVGGSGSYRAWFDLATGTVGTVGASLTGAGINPLGGGLYLCWAYRTPTAGAMTAYIGAGSADNTDTYLGDGVSGIKIHAAQLEAGAFPTSYIPTTSAAATRAADSASMTGTNFSSWFNASEGTFVVEAETVFTTSANRIMCAAIKTASSNEIRMMVNTSNQVRQYVYDGASQANYGTSTITDKTFFKTAAVYKANDFALSFNGGSVETDTSGTVPTVDEFYIGKPLATNQYINGHVKTLTYYATRLPDATLQSLTT